MIGGGCAEKLGFKVRRQEMSVYKHPVQASSGVTGANSFVTPREGAIFRFDVR